MHTVALDKEHRTALAQDGKIHVVGQALGGGESVVVPGAALGVAAFYPDDVGVGACGGKCQVVGDVYKGAVGAQTLYVVPQPAHYRCVQKHLGRLHKHHPSRRSIQHRGQIVQHGALAVGETGGRVRRRAGRGRAGVDQQTSVLHEYAVAGKEPLPAVDDCIEPHGTGRYAGLVALAHESADGLAHEQGREAVKLAETVGAHQRRAPDSLGIEAVDGAGSRAGRRLAVVERAQGRHGKRPLAQ